jgi:hypothetical protein
MLLLLMVLAVDGLVRRERIEARFLVQQGRACRAAGVPLSANPYVSDLRRARTWALGWMS